MMSEEARDRRTLTDEIECKDEEIAALRTENDRLREQVAGLTAALEPFARYADELLWGDRGARDDDVVLRWPYYGPPRVIVRRSDFKALRAAIPISPVIPNTGLPISPVVPNTGLPISPVVPNTGLSVSPAPPTEVGKPLPCTASTVTCKGFPSGESS
jgi:hypothetical protein